MTDLMLLLLLEVVVGLLLASHFGAILMPSGLLFRLHSITFTQQKFESRSNDLGCMCRTCVDAKIDFNFLENLSFSLTQLKFFSHTTNFFSHTTKFFSHTTKNFFSHTTKSSSHTQLNFFSHTTKNFSYTTKTFCTQVNFLSTFTFFSITLN